MAGKKSFLNTGYMDTSIRPGENFFKFVNGAWLEKTIIPEDRERWGSFDELRKKTDKNTQDLIEAIQSADIQVSGSDTQKAITFVQEALDLERIEEVSFKPIQESIHRIESVQSKEALLELLCLEVKNALPHFFGISVFPDLMDSKTNVAYLGAAALGLPERDYYLNKGEEDIEIRRNYSSYIDKLLSLVASSLASGDEIVNFETHIAQTLLSKEESRNPENIYHPFSVDNLLQVNQYVGWKKIIRQLGIETDRFIVTEKAYFEALDALLQETPLNILKGYLVFSLLNNLASYLSKEFETLKFDFYGRQLSGAQQMKPRVERVINVVNSLLGEAIGKLYVERYFSSNAKSNAVELVEYVKKAFARRIEKLTWMEEGTKKKALQKLESFGVKIAYPDKWKDYSKLHIHSKEEGGSYVENIIHVQRWKLEKDLQKIGQPVDTSEWYMPPQMVNAYYSPLSNEIVFPAAILQAPFYHVEADPAVNFGGIGAVIAHEMTHGFDDQGRKFDHKGNMKEWWSADDKTSFESLTRKLIDQADHFEILKGLSLNGAYTLGENLADLGGVLIAYDAMISYFNDYPKPALIDGYTQEQRFFISWATVWRGKTREKSLRKQIATDPHPPFEFRALNPLSNTDSFYEAFQVEPGEAMYRGEEDRVRVW